MQYVTRPHARNLVAWAERRPEVLVLSADLTSSCEAEGFRDAYPERFFSFGLAEQNMVGFAAGLAREGFLPLVHTFAVFICRRAFDQVAMSVAYSNLPVRFLGFLPGITTPGGATHQAIDDVGLMRLLPNMTVLDCGDATEVEGLLDATESIPGPVYARVLRGEVPRLFEPERPLQVGRARLLRKGGDLCLLSSGICTEEALRACQALIRRGLDVCHLHVSTLKPFDDPLLLELASSARLGVITMENHSVIGGLGSAMAERIAEAGLGKRLLRLGIQDQYAHGGSRAYLARIYGLDARALVSAAERMAGTSFDIEDQELGAFDLQPVRSGSRVEDL